MPPATAPPPRSPKPATPVMSGAPHRSRRHRRRSTTDPGRDSRSRARSSYRRPGLRPPKKRPAGHSEGPTWPLAPRPREPRAPHRQPQPLARKDLQLRKHRRLLVPPAVLRRRKQPQRPPLLVPLRRLPKLPLRRRKRRRAPLRRRAHLPGRKPKPQSRLRRAKRWRPQSVRSSGAPRVRASTRRRELPSHPRRRRRCSLAPSRSDPRQQRPSTISMRRRTDRSRLRARRSRRAFKEAIEAATPKPTTEAEADKVVESGAKTASATMHGQLATQKDAAVGPLKNPAAAEVAAGSHAGAAGEAARARTSRTAARAGVSRARRSASPLPAGAPRLLADRAPTDQAMAENDVTKEQLEKGNEPAFGADARRRGRPPRQHEAQAEAKYRKAEAKVQDNAERQAQGALAEGLGDMHGARRADRQGRRPAAGTKAKDAGRAPAHHRDRSTASRRRRGPTSKTSSRRWRPRPAESSSDGLAARRGTRIATRSRKRRAASAPGSRRGATTGRS